MDRLQQSVHTVILTGSGTSAESGVPTFRDAQSGLWANFRPEELATPEAFEQNPQRVWQWYQWRRELVRQAEPNDGHTAIVELEQRLNRVTLITQNVDGLHQRAGSRAVIEFHGNITRTRCSTEKCRLEVESFAAGPDEPPLCRECGGYLRPDVVWFGESIPHGAMDAALSATKESDLFFAIGTSAQVQPAAGLAEIAKHRGAALVEINPNPTPLTPLVDFVLAGASGSVLPGLVSALDKLAEA